MGPTHPYADFLALVRKPGRYLGGEEQQVVKAWDGLTCAFALAFPDAYEVGMSHLGTRIIYDIVNREPDLVCERAFSPWSDMEAQLRARNLPLTTLETHQPLHVFDVVGVSLQYELSYTNVLLNLDLGGIPLRAAERSDADPIVLAGGPTATHPEPLAPFIDVFLVGEAEEVLPELLRTVGRLRKQGRPRAEVLAALSRLAGVYVPSFYRVAVDPRTGLEVVAGRTPQGVAAGAPERVGRVWVRDLDAFEFPERFPVPYAEAIFDRASVEITRGCTEGCRFCQAGIIYRPVRERSPAAITKAVLGGLDNAGFSETSLTALSTADVSCINPLIKTLVPELAKRKAKLGVSSLRAYGLDGELLDEIKRVGITGLTFAPEAGTQRMRDVINKNVSEQDILDSARRIFERGMGRMKMYFIMGLPTETDADVAGIVQTGLRVLDVAKSMNLPRRPAVTISVSQHVPKPHTPFQWAAMDSLEDLRQKGHFIREQARRAGLSVKTHDERHGWLECLFARGDRRMGDALERAYRAGARFDGWRECFDFECWLDALDGAGIDPTLYTQTLPVGARLPWDHIEIGLEEDFLATEYRKAVAGRASPPCGKPFGDKIHHAALEDAQSDSRRLVCYDCGIACDMTQMRDERVQALRALRKPARAPPAGSAPGVVPLSRLKGRLPPSRLDDDSVFKASAEAPASRLRLVFAKHPPLNFMGHLDLLRVFPRMLRRAGVEVAFSRGFNPVPRMVFGPALALGIAAEHEVVDIEIVLPESGLDLLAELPAPARSRIADDLVTRLRGAAPPGLELKRARLVEPGERRLGQLVAAADYAVELPTDHARRLRRQLPTQLVVHREIKANKRRRPGVREVDVRRHLLAAEVEADRDVLRFRLAFSNEGGARPREVVEALAGTSVPDNRYTRLQLLTRGDQGYVALT